MGLIPKRTQNECTYELLHLSGNNFLLLASYYITLDNLKRNIEL